MSASPIIMIVDDDSDDRDILRDAFIAALDGTEAEFMMAENGDKAMEQLLNNPEDEGELPQVIMLDLNMPGKDGRETLSDVKADDRLKTIPVIVFTTSSSQRDKIAAYQLNANCFLTKPDTFNKLVNMCESVCRLFLS